MTPCTGDAGETSGTNKIAASLHLGAQKGKRQFNTAVFLRFREDSENPQFRQGRKLTLGQIVTTATSRVT